MPFGIGFQELVLILLIFLVLFGGKKLPELARNLGSSIKLFKESIRGDSSKESKKTEKAR